jgi:hypothetical protein
MNRLLPGAMPAPVNDPAPVPSQAASPVPGSKLHLLAQAKELGVGAYGTKADIWGRISAAQAANVGRRVRAPREVAPQVAGEGAAPFVPPMPDTPGNRLLMANAPAVVEQSDPFTDALSRFEAFMGAR